MAKKSKSPGAALRQLTKRQKAVVLPIMVIIGAGAVILAILAIIVMPRASDGVKRGVAANGFHAFAEKGSDLGIGKVVGKDKVVEALGAKAKSVKDPDISSVFNYNGDRSQTLTFEFVRADGKNASLHVDMTLFKNTSSMKAQNIFIGTEKAKMVNGNQSYYMHAQTLGALREYRLLVVNGLKAYKFVLSQPYNDISINEVAAVATLMKAAQQAKL